MATSHSSKTECNSLAENGWIPLFNRGNMHYSLSFFLSQRKYQSYILKARVL